MEKRIFTLILVVVIAILVGVGIVTKQTREPILREIMKKQDIIISGQGRNQGDLNPGKGTSDSQIANLNLRQRNLELRLSAIENKLSGLFNGGPQPGGSGGNVRQAPPAEDLSEVYDIAVAHSPIKGNKNAPVTIVEFVDFQCPFCARFHPPVNEVLKAYPKKVNYMLKNFPLGFHQEAKPAAKAAFAAGEQGKYWEMVEALLENGKNLSSAKYDELATTLGLDLDKFKSDYKDKNAQWEDYIQKDIALGGQVSVRGTPTFYINGRKTNARDLNAFKREIDQILKEKK